MGDRIKSGPDASPPLSSGDFKLDMIPMPADAQDVRKWETNKPGDALLRERGRIEGISSLPYKNAASFEQAQGRFWRRV
ncbi:MAG TPA: hypothetical protein VKA94_02410, partial [Hyphomicrobiales bacterium]|nr:hypothetical protein [Hyphomicrobiales bacterium]